MDQEFLQEQRHLENSAKGTETPTGSWQPDRTSWSIPRMPCAKTGQPSPKPISAGSTIMTRLTAARSAATSEKTESPGTRQM